MAGKPFHRTYRTKALAEAARAELLTATRQGRPFDTETGVPVSMLPVDVGPTWYAHACAFIDSKWPRLAPKSRKSIAEALATITPAMLGTGRGRPAEGELREALYGWSFNSARRQATPPPEHLAAAVSWIAGNSLPVSVLNDASHVRRVLDSLATTSTGKPASANTIKRWRATLGARSATPSSWGIWRPTRWPA